MTRKLSRIALALALCSALAAPAFGKGAMSVQVKQGQVRSTPSFLGKIVANLSYGDRVETVEESNGWIKVVLPGKKGTGWMHGSALSAKRIALRAGTRAEQAAASSGELALAGKGFNADIEAEFKKKNRNLDFATIDRMQGIKVPQEKVVSFIKEGGLQPAGGGGK